MTTKQARQMFSLPKVNTDHVIVTVLIAVVLYVALTISLLMLRDSHVSTLQFLHGQFRVYNAHVVELVENAEGDGILPPGFYFNANRDIFERAEISFSKREWIDVNDIDQDVQVYLELEDIVAQVEAEVRKNTTVAYHYSQLNKTLKADRSKIGELYDRYNREVSYFNNKKDGLVYTLHFWFEPSPILEPFEFNGSSVKSGG